MPRPILCTVNPKAIAHNIRVLKQRTPQSSCFAVVKANAYGHGLLRVLSGLQEADGLALLEIDQAENLRRAGWSRPIVLLEGCFDAQDFQQALALECDWVVHNAEQLVQLEQHSDALCESEHKPVIYLKFNTGMNRLGFCVEEITKAIERLQTIVTECDLPSPVLMTHFANADVGSVSSVSLSVHTQHQRLAAILPEGWRSSLANSAGCLNWPDYAGDIVRPGISIYGAAPGPLGASEQGLKPAMSLNSQIIAIQTVQPGEAVGYGSRYRASKQKRVAVVACGYADGYPRHAPDGTPVWVKDRRCALIGRVSMDMLTVDVSEVQDVSEGEFVQLFGQYLPVDDVAEPCGTIGYELLCAVAARVPVQVV